MVEKMNKKQNLILLLLASALHVNTGQRVSTKFNETPAIEAPMEVALYKGTLYATCEVTPDPNLPTGQPEIRGQVLFKQTFAAGTLQVIINLRGLAINDHQKRAIHIHQFGDLSQGYVSAGPHYNPLQVDHPGHPGDMGNYVASHGMIKKFFLDGATLFGGHSVLGRAVVIHEKEDDFGLGIDEESKRSGNAGMRIAGCVIGISTSSLWEKAVKAMED